MKKILLCSAVCCASLLYFVEALGGNATSVPEKVPSRTNFYWLEGTLVRSETGLTIRSSSPSGKMEETKAYWGHLLQEDIELNKVEGDLKKANLSTTPKKWFGAMCQSEEDYKDFSVLKMKLNELMRQDPPSIPSTFAGKGFYVIIVSD